VDAVLLETFIAVADAGGLSAAGSMLGVPQSIVSRRIKELESACSAQLLYRHGRGVKLTPAGEQLYQSAGPLIAQFNALLVSVADAEASPSGAVTIAGSPSLMSAIGLRVIDELHSRYPDIRPNFVSGFSRYVHEWLLQGRVDIGVLSDIGLSSHLLAEALGSVPIVLAAPPRYRLPEGPVAFAELARWPLIVPSRGQGLRRHLEQEAAQRGVTLDIVYEIDDIYLTKDLILAGKAAALLPRLAIPKEVAARLIKERRVDPETAATFIVVTSRNRPITAAMKATVAVLKAVCASTFAALA
jgi:LysR family nitrogen assimilation transcriptional regulator